MERAIVVYAVRGYKIFIVFFQLFRYEYKFIVYICAKLFGTVLTH